MVRGVSPNSAYRLLRVTPKVLAQSLRGLERDGLVSRTVRRLSARLARRLTAAGSPG